MNGPLAIICQGGAGVIENRETYAEGLAVAIEAGYRLLRQSASALEAVVEAVRIMEDDPVFNCGTGSNLNLDGVAEMDAGVMTQDGRFGGVCCITDVRNPILVARKVMTDTDHVLLCGPGAAAFARLKGLPEYDVVTDRSRQRLLKLKQEGTSGYLPKLASRLQAGGRQPENPGTVPAAQARGADEGQSRVSSGTVGAVAFDKHGVLAAATSSGGITGRLAGRVGDSALPGAGTYAGPSGAVSCTGHGEAIINLMLGRDVVDRMRTVPASTAVILAMAEAKRKKAACGLVGIDARGQVGFGHTTPDMAYGYMVADRLFLFTEGKSKQRGLIS